MDVERIEAEQKRLIESTIRHSSDLQVLFRDAERRNAENLVLMQALDKQSVAMARIEEKVSALSEEFRRDQAERKISCENHKGDVKKDLNAHISAGAPYRALTISVGVGLLINALVLASAWGKLNERVDNLRGQYERGVDKK